MKKTMLISFNQNINGHWKKDAILKVGVVGNLSRFQTTVK